MLRRLLALPQLAPLLSQINLSGYYLLTAAFEGGCVECLKLLQSDPYFRAVSPKLGTALHLVASQGHAEMLAHLLGLKVFDDRLDVQDWEGCTAVCKAVKASSVECFKLLYDAGATLGIRDKRGLSVLHTATLLDDPELLGVLLQAGGTHVDAQTVVSARCVLRCCAPGTAA
eukprot:m.478214 g.478214  ORF g.478214 m.478214 type:complete len:172 (-) comp57167_c0_seq3:899-1414(-)